MSRICRHYQVFGQVQGVWYRGSTRDRARQLGLSGWVRNRTDGAVELVACGAPRELETLKAWLHEGPSAARVERVEETDAAEPPDGAEFVIRP